MKKSTILLNSQCKQSWRLNTADQQLQDKTKRNEWSLNAGWETSSWELSHLRPSLHLHVMKMTVGVVWYRISLIIFLHWKHFTEYFPGRYKYLMHRSKIFSVCSIFKNYLKIHFSKFPNSKQTPVLTQTLKENSSCNTLGPGPQWLPSHKLLTLWTYCCHCFHVSSVWLLRAPRHRDRRELLGCRSWYLVSDLLTAVNFTSLEHSIQHHFSPFISMVI